MKMPPVACDLEAAVPMGSAAAVAQQHPALKKVAEEERRPRRPATLRRPCPWAPRRRRRPRLRRSSSSSPAKVEDPLQKGTDFYIQGSILEEDLEYQVIVDCNALSVDIENEMLPQKKNIENEIIIIYSFIQDRYRFKFPGLESLVYLPIDYACVIKKSGNEMDLTPVDLEGLSPSAIIMVVSLTASTSGKPLSEDNLGKKPLKCNRWQCCCLQTDGYCRWSGSTCKNVYL